MSSLQVAPEYSEFYPDEYGLVYATPRCGGGLCYSVGLKKCVVCGSTSKPKPRCNLTASICKANNRTATSCSVTSNCVCNCKFPSGKTSLQYAQENARRYKTGTPPKQTNQMTCRLGSSLCLANNPRAKSCGVRVYKNGSCVCDCVDAVTGRSYLPVPQAGTVARTMPHVTSTNLKPGVVPPGAGAMPVVETPVWIASMDPGPIKELFMGLLKIWTDIMLIPNLWGQPIGANIDYGLKGGHLEEALKREYIKHDPQFRLCPVCIDCQNARSRGFEPRRVMFDCNNCNNCMAERKVGSF